MINLAFMPFGKGRSGRGRTPLALFRDMAGGAYGPTEGRGKDDGIKGGSLPAYPTVRSKGPSAAQRLMGGPSGATAVGCADHAREAGVSAALMPFWFFGLNLYISCRICTLAECINGSKWPTRFDFSGPRFSAALLAPLTAPRGGLLAATWALLVPMWA